MAVHPKCFLKRCFLFIILLSVLLAYGNAFAGYVVQDNFESSTAGSVPTGWVVENSGSAIQASSAAFYDGAKSLFMQGQPYGGANLLKDIPVFTSGKYLISFSMKVNTTAWTGSDGAAIAHFMLNGNHQSAIGVVKVSGVYKLSLREDTEQISDFPADINSWVKYAIQIDLDANKALYYVNGVLVGNRSLGTNSTHNNRIVLGTGAAGPGGGNPAAYFDAFTIENLTSPPKIFFSSNKNGSDDIWKMDPDGNNRERVTTLSGNEAYPRVSPDGRKIAFNSDATGSYEVYVMNVDGTEICQLTSGKNTNGQLTWDPASTKIYYAAPAASIYDAAVRSVNADGTGDAQVFDHVGYHDVEVDVSPDGNYLVYIYENCCWTPNRSIRLRNLSSGTDVEILAADSYSDFYPRFSPDGNSIIWTKNRSTNPYAFGYDIWRMNKDGSSKTNLTGAYSTLAFFGASYTRDGNKIVVSASTNGGDSNIYSMNADGSGLQQLTTDTSNEGSPDFVTIIRPPNKIVYHSDQSGNDDIWVMDEQGGNKVQLTNSAANESQPKWSKDGLKIVYTSDASGNDDIWVMSRSGSSKTQLTTNSAGDSQPIWTPDGTKILFFSTRDGGRDVYIMDASGANQTRLTTVNGWTGRDGIGISPDGTKIAYTSQPSGANWGYYNELYSATLTCSGVASTCSLSNTLKIASFDSQIDMTPSFTPDGKILWSSGRHNPYGTCSTNCYFSTQEIYRINPDGSGEVKITSNTVTSDVQPVSSPDGGKIIFSSDRASGSANVANTYDLWIVNSDGTGMTQLTNTSAYSEGGADWWASGVVATYTLTVAKSGTGTGTVTSNPTGISCGGSCAESYSSGTSVVLTATPDSGSTFIGWLGVCSGTGTCTVTMDAAKSVTAAFGDTTPPDTTITANPTNPTNNTSAAFSFTATEANATFQCQLDAGGYSTCNSPKSYSGLSAGIHTFYVKATDAAGNTDATPASYAWTIDLTPPVTILPIDGRPAPITNSTSATFTFSSESGATFQCQFDGGTWTACTSPASFTGLPAGNHTLLIKAIDTAGNTETTPISHSWTIDITAPNAPSVAGTTPTNNRTPSWGWASGGNGGNGTFRYKLDSSDLTTGATATTATAYTPTGNLSEGLHTLYVQERDAAGNWSASGSFAIVVDITAPSAGSGGLIQLAKTGQTKCYNSSGTEITCLGTGQDGEIQAGIAWPNPRFTSNADTSLTDNLTGLIWAKDGSTPTFNSCTGGTKTWTAALAYVTCLSTNNYLGHNDWRLPNSIELESLGNVQWSNQSTWLNGQGFINVQSEYYWSSSTGAYNTNGAWIVDMAGGYYVDRADDKSLNHYVWPVRGNSSSGAVQLPKTGQITSYAAGDDGDLQKGIAWPSTRFTVSGDCVTDRLTGLMWTKDANLAGGRNTWQELLTYADNLNLCGYTDWRLPNRKELFSLLDYSKSVPALPENHPFSNVKTEDSNNDSCYWSSSTFAYLKHGAFVVAMGNGSIGASWKSSGGVYASYGWPVRGGLSSGTGTGLSINSGATAAKTLVVTLNLSANDANGVTHMMISNDAAFTGASEETYVSSKAWTLTSGDGTKTVYVKFKDAAGNWSQAYSDTIILDSTAPVVTPSVAGGTYNETQTVTLICNDGSGTGCGSIYYTIDGNDPTTSSTVYSSPITISATTILKYFAVDSAGNSSPIQTAIYTIQGFNILNTSSLSNGLVAWYPFNGNANDESGNGNNGIVNGATPTVDRFGNANGAYSFDGVNDDIEVSNSNSLNITGNQLSISYWMKWQNSPSYCLNFGVSKGGYDLNKGYEILTRGNCGAETQNGFFQMTTGNTTNGYLLLENANIYRDTWVHVVGVLNNTTETIYINGQPMRDVTVSMPPKDASDTSLYIGTRAPGNQYVGWLNGSMDDVRIYNRALSASEIQALYGSAGTINAVQGDTRSATLNLSSYGGYSQSADLTYAWVGTMPAAATVNLTPSTITPTPSGASANVSFTAGANTSAGAYTLRITATSGTITKTADILVSVSTPLAIPTLTLDPATKGTSYTPTVSASGGVGAYTFSVASGTIPAGLTLNSNGAFSGTPTTRGVYTFTIQAVDNDGHSSSKEYTVRVYDPAYRKLVLESTSWSVYQNEPTGWIYAKVLDDYDASVTMTASATIDISSSSSTGRFSSNGESWSVGNVLRPDIPSGSSSKSFLYKDSAAGSFTITAAGVSGNASAQWAAGSHALTVAEPPQTDTTPPDTAITGNPPLVTNSASATFTFSVNEEPATFECNLDGAGWVSCTSPKVYDALSVADHTFQVRAKDAAVNVDPSPASYAWKIDQTGPLGTGFGVLPKTGQTTCYDTAGAVISCVGTGQDGEIQAGTAWPNSRFMDNGNQTVTDKLTGLIWTKDGNAPGPTACEPGTAKTWQGALDYVICLNTNNYQGYNDWRLPNRNELTSLVNAGQSDTGAWLNTQGYYNIQENAIWSYWSSSTLASSTRYAWVVSLYAGEVAVDYKYKTSYYAWPVRSGQSGSVGSFVISLPQTGQTTCYNTDGAVIACAGTGQDGEIQAGVAWPNPRFVDNGNQTITDKLTGLIWAKDGNAPGPTACGPGTTKTWQGALDYVKCLNTNNYQGHNDWRLPNHNELKSLVNAGQSDTGAWLNTQGYYNVQVGDAGYYWSSSTEALNTGNAWFLFMQGYVNPGDKSRGQGVWPVRGGVSTVTGTGISINNGAPATNNTSVTLSLSAIDANGVTHMMVSNDANFTGASEESYATSKAGTLLPGEGEKTVYAKFKDTAGNWSSVYSDTITLDLAAPTLAIGLPSSILTGSGDVTYTVTYSGTDFITLAPGNITLNTTGSANGTVSVTGTGSTTRTITVSAITGNGTLGISLAAGTGRDAAGNQTASAGPSGIFTVDNAAPTATMDTKPASLTSATSASFAFSSELGATFQCKLDSGNYSNCSGSVSYSSLAEGNHVFWLKTTDVAGNITETNYSWIVDTTGPVGGGGSEQGSFALTGNMNSARSCHTSTLLANGKVLVVAGRGSSSSINAADLYDSATGIFTSTGSLNVAREDHTATRLANGKVLIVGGDDSAINDALSSAEMYDPSSGLFTTTGSLGTARGLLHTATLLPNGKVLIAGGLNAHYSTILSSAELYDPASGAFAPTGNMNSARYGHTATLLSSGKVLIVGGSSVNPAILASAELYDPATGIFTTIAGNMNIGRADATATQLPNGKLLIAGGWTGSVSTNTAELFDPVAGTFELTGNLNVGRYFHTATLLANGKVLLAGGHMGNSHLFNNSAELYDPTLGTFTQTAGMVNIRTRHEAVLLPNGNVLITGGADGNITVNHNTAELYIPPASAAISINANAAATNTTSVTLTLYATDANGVAKMMISNDAFFTEANEETYITSKAWSLPAGDGEKTVCVKFKDNAGNWSQVYCDSIVLDTIVPVTTISDKPAGITNSTSATFTFALDVGTTFQCQLDGGAWTTCTSPATYTGLSAGDHTLLIKATDAAGNTEIPVSYTWTIDVVAPNAPVVSGTTPTNSQTPTWTWGTGGNSGNGTYRYKLDNSDLSTGATETIATSYTPSSNLSENSHTLYVQERDASGNWSNSGSFGIVVDITAPTSSQDATGNGTWTRKADFGGVGGRQTSVGFSIGNKGYMGMGWIGGTNYAQDFWEYDPVTNAWTQKADFGGGVRSGATGFSIGSKGYVGLGYNPSVNSDFWEYDPAANTWTRKADFGGIARAVAAGFSIGTKGYIGTGASSAGPRNDFWEYDPSTDTWTRKADFGGVGREFPIGFSLGNKGYMGTGWVGSGTLTNDFWEYDPSNNTWTKKADFGGGIRSTAVGFSIGAKGYVGTGDAYPSGSRKDFWEYDPSSNTWIQEADFGGEARYLAAGFSIGNKGYIGAGSVEGGSLRKDFWEFTPSGPGIIINAGAASTKVTSVTIALSANDANGVVKMMVSDDAAFTGANEETYITSKAWSLPAGDGIKTVYAKFKDAAGNWSQAYSDSIVLDTTGPTVVADPPAGTYLTAQSVSLTCNDASGSGCEKIYFTTNDTEPTTSSAVYSGSINIPSTTTLKFFAVDQLGTPGPVQTALYTIQGVTMTAGSIKVVKGETRQTTATLTSIGGFNAAMNLSYAWQGSAPANVAVDIAPATVTPTPTGASAGVSLTTDSAAAAGNYTLRVAADGGGYAASANIPVTVANPLAFTTSSPISGVKGQSLAPIAATGGIGLLTFGLAVTEPAGTLPPGVTFNADGTFSGSPAARGTYVFTVRCSDTDGHSVDRQYTLRVYDPAYRHLVLESASWSLQEDSGVSDWIKAKVLDDYDVSVAVTAISTINITSSSSTGQFSLSGSFSGSEGNSLLVDIPVGSSLKSFKYRDSTAGIFTIAVTGWEGTPSEGWAPASHQITVVESLPMQYNLSIAKTGTGSGSVTVSTGSISWEGNNGTATYNVGQSVTLTATANPASSTFAGWTGCDTYNADQCTVSMNAARNVAAAFTLKTYNITASAGANGGISPAGSLSYNHGSSPAFTITPDTGYHIADVLVDGSSVGAVGSYTFNNIAAGHTISATFAVNVYALTVTKTGTGSGNVTVSPGTINWTNNTGTAAYNYNTVVQLTASESAGFTFTGWSGACSGSGAAPTCTVTMDAAKSVTANFADITPPTGLIAISSGAAYNTQTAVTLSLLATDASGVSKMTVSNDANFTTGPGEENYAPSKAWILTDGDGTKTVYVKFKDAVGNWSQPFSDTIVLDTVAPTVAAQPATGTFMSAQSVTLTCDDGPGSGCANIYFTTDKTEPTAASTRFTEPISISATTTLKFFAVDAAGKTSAVRTETYTFPDVTMTGGNIKVVQGEARQTTITLKAVDGFNSSMTLNPQYQGTAPANASVSITPDTVTPTTSGATAVVSFTAGTTTAADSYTIRVTATGGGLTRTVDIQVTVAPPLAISTPSLPDGVKGQPYSAAVAATGGIAPYTYTKTLGQLPGGLTLNANGTISGTPTARGTFAFTVQAADSDGQGVHSATQEYTVRIYDLAYRSLVMDAGSWIVDKSTATETRASDLIMVMIRDDYGNLVNADANTLIRITSSSLTGRFSADGSSFPSSSLAPTIYQGNGTTLFFYKDTTAGTFTLTASGITGQPSASWQAGSHAITVWFDPPDTELTASATQSSVYGQGVTVTGLLKDIRNNPNVPLPSKTVTLAFTSPSESVLNRTTQTGSDGRFTYSADAAMIDAAGPWTVRASFSEPASYKDSTAIASFTIDKADTRLGITTSASSVPPGGQVTVSGQLSAFTSFGVGLSGIDIVVEFIGPDGSTIYATTVKTSDAAGHFAYPYTIPSTGPLGLWSIRARFIGSGNLNSSDSEAKSLNVASSPGYAILVQGDLGGTYRNNYSASLDDIYKKLRDRSFPTGNIWYLSHPAASHDPGIASNAVASKENVRKAITEWARDRIKSPSGGIAPLYIVLMDHGSVGQFHIDPDTITPEELNGWISTLEADIKTNLQKDLTTVVINGSCYSGSFIPALSKTHRVIITSGAEDEETLQGPDSGTADKVFGEYFVYYLFSYLAQGENLMDAFKDAAQETHQERKCTGNDCKTNSVLGNQGNTRQHPLLDDNGDGKGSWMGVAGQEDGEITSHLVLGLGANPATIKITEVMPTTKVMMGTASVLAFAKTSNYAQTMASWVKVRKPLFVAPDSGGTGQVVMNLTRIEGTPNPTAGRWEYNITPLNEAGAYTLYYYAMDSNGNVLPPVAGTLYVDTPDNHPPAAFSLSSPADSAELNDAMMIFKWAKSVDPDNDPVTYTLKIYSEETGNEIKRYELIPQEFYFMNAAQEKESNGVIPLFTTGKSYLWKVEAVDDQGKSVEMPSRRFLVRFTNAITGVITGIVYSDVDFAKIASATITATIGGQLVNIPVVDGTFVAAVTPGMINLSGVSSGYQNASVSNVTVLAGQAATVNIVMLSTVLKGDLDGSGTVDLADAILAQRIVSGIGLPTGVTVHKENSVNAGGAVGVADVLYILQYLAGLRL